ncbi:MAG: chemotaxis protein CheW [Agarilytica sp.]
MTKPSLSITNETEIPCMLLPMVEHTIILPNTSVAEMCAVTGLEAIENAPEWLMGNYNWRGTQVPVVSIEGVNGGEVIFNRGGRIAVLNNTGQNPSLPFIAIHTQGIPRMSRVGEDDITQDEGAPHRHFDVMAVKVGMEEFFLPDVAALEDAYLKFLSNKTH